MRRFLFIVWLPAVFSTTSCVSIPAFWDNPDCNYDQCGNIESFSPVCLGGVCKRMPSSQDSSVTIVCPDKPEPCEPGKYSSMGVCVACTDGHYCPGDSWFPHPCSACQGGAYRNSECSASADTECATCPANAVVDVNDISKCVCKEGYRESATGPVCEACPAGKTSVGSTCTDCADGTYSLGAEPCTPCPAGSYCPVKNLAPAPCDAGYYCPAASMLQVACDIGNYCPPGSTAPLPCNAGVFCEDPTSMIPCPAGQYCTYQNYPFCLDGSYCPEGSSAEQDCQAGYLCETPDFRARCPMGFH
jgi:hypothetical protein